MQMALAQLWNFVGLSFGALWPTKLRLDITFIAKVHFRVDTAWYGDQWRKLGSTSVDGYPLKGGLSDNAAASAA